jgi:hypothetical protein
VTASLLYLCISPENTLLVSSLAAAEVTKLTHVLPWLQRVGDLLIIGGQTCGCVACCQGKFWRWLNGTRVEEDETRY